MSTRPNDPETSDKRKRDLGNSQPPHNRLRFSDATEPLPEHISFCARVGTKHHDESEAFIRSYPAVAKSSLKCGIHVLDELNLQRQKFGIGQLRKKVFTAECKNYIDIIKHEEDVKAITAKEYEQRIQQFNPSWENSLVLCTSKEARDLLQRFDLRVPLLVPWKLNDSPEPR